MNCFRTVFILGLLMMSCANAAEIQLRSNFPAEKTAELQTRYKENLLSLEKARATMQLKWQAANRSERAKLVKQARQRLLTAFYTEIFPAWYGTEWNFSGTTQTPGEGKIACGYFVTTCLKQAGFDCQRVKLAQQASQSIIRTFVDSRKEIKVSSDLPMGKFLDHIRKTGPGLYIVGLDTHTGFVGWDGETFAFIHSSYYRPPFSVTSEPADSKNPLKDSRYRMIGKVLGDKMIEKWITGAPFVMVK